MKKKMIEDGSRTESGGREGGSPGDGEGRIGKKHGRRQSEFVDGLFVAILFVVVAGFEILLGWAVYTEIAGPSADGGSSVNLVPLVALGILTLIAAGAVFPRKQEFERR